MQSREVFGMHSVKVFLVTAVVTASSLYALDYRDSTRIAPGDYLLRSLDQHQDTIFDSYRTVDLGADIGVGSDCGRIDFTGTLRASLRNLLDSRYFADIGKNIIGSSP